MPLSPYEETLLGDEKDNPYRETLHLQEQSGEVRLRVSAKAASAKTPDRQAEILGLSQRTGLPADVIDRNFDAIRKRSEITDTDYSRMLQESPKLSEWVANPDNMALAKDDLPQLGAVEQLLTYGANLYRSAVASIPASSGALYGLGRSAAELGELVTRPVNRLLGQEAQADALSRWFAEQARGQEALAQAIRPSPEQIGSTERAVYSGVESTAQNLLLLPLSLMSGGAGGTLAGMGMVTGGQAYQQAREQGVGVLPAAVFAGAQGAVEVATEKIPVDIWLKELHLHTGFMKFLTRELAAELPGEQVATIFQDLNEWAVLPENKNKTFRDYLADRPDAAVQTLIATLVGTATQVGITRATDRAISGKPTQQLFFEQLGKGVSESKTFQRLPDKVREYIAQATKDGPLEKVFVDSKAWNTYWQDQKIDPADVAQELGISKEQYRQALATNEQLAIPTADYAAKIAPTEHNGFFAQELRLGPEQMNAREIQEYATTLESELGAATPPPTGPEASAARVREDVLGQMIDRGFDRTAVESYATLYASAFRTMGERAGVDPFELYRQYGLEIGRPIPEVLQSIGQVDTLDLMLDRLRAGEVPQQREIFGPSLVEFLKSKGGVVDEGGELKALEVDAERKAFAKNLIQPEGLSLDRAREAAAEVGYLPQTSTVAEFLDAIERDVRGQPVYSKEAVDPAKLEQMTVLQQLEDYLKAVGVDLKTASNEEIKRVLNEAAISPTTGQVLNQPALPQPARITAPLDAAVQALMDQASGYVRDQYTLRSGESTSLFIGPEGHLVDIGEQMHAQALDKAGLIRKGVTPTTGMEESLRQNRLVRVHVYGRELAFHMMHEPTGPQLDQTQHLVNQRPEGIGYDIRLPDGRVAQGHTSRPQVFWDALFGTKDYRHYLQQIAEEKRGAIRFGANRQFSIELLEKADLSTFLHESGHFFLEVFGDTVDELLTRPGDLTETQQRMIADYGALLKQLGVEDRSMIGTEQHEQFARTFEAYLREGKAPSAELRSIFSRFRAWLVSIYKSLRQLNVKLTPEVTGVMDRLLATDQEIQQAEQQAGIEAMFTDAAQAGMSEKEFAAYRETVQQASDRARDKLQKQVMDEYNRTREDWWQTKRELVHDQVAREVHGQREYMLLAFLQKGTLPDGSALPEGIEAVKLSRDALVEQYGKEFLKRLPRPYVYSREGGMAPNVLADLFGYSSGDELIQAILNARPMNALIEAETDSRMRDRYGDMLLDGSIAEKARTTVMTSGRSDIIQAEMRALAKKKREVAPFLEAGKARTREGVAMLASVPPISVVRDWAETRVAGMRARDLQPNTYWVAARQAGRLALEASAKDNFDEALTQKRKELLNVELYRATTNAREQIQANVNYLQSFSETAKRQRIGKAGGDYLEQIDQLLEQYEFKSASLKQIEKRKRLADWIADQERQGLPVDLPAEVIQSTRQQNYKDLTVEQLQGLSDSVEMIEHLAQLKNRLLKSVEQRTFAQAVGEMTDGIRKFGGGKRKTTLEPDLPGEAGARLAAEFFASHRKLSSFLREMDGFVDGGVMWERIMRPINDAANEEAVRTEKATLALQEIFKTAYKGEETALYRKTFIPAINDSLSKMGRLMVALNWGNADNRQRLMDGRHWNETQVQAILNALDERDWKFVQAIWDHLNSYWADIAAKEKRVTGVVPEKVEAVPVQTRYGEFKGGYFPIMYEKKLTARAGANQEADFAKSIQQASYGRATTRRGHTEARLEHVEEPVRLHFDVIFNHMNQVIHDLTHHEMLIDVGRLLSNREVQDAIYSEYGDIVYDQIKGAVRDIALGNAPAPKWWAGLNYARQGVVTASLAWNAFTSVLQPFQLSNSAARIGVKWVAKGLVRWGRDAASMENSVRWIHEQSDFMRLRHNTQIRELNELRNQVGLKSGRISRWVNDGLHQVKLDNVVDAQVLADSYFYFIQKAQQIADVPTWLGAYEKAMDGGEDEKKAVALADQAVIDAQGSGHIKDLASVERGPVWKVFTTFYSYQNLLLNQSTEAIKKASLKDPVSMGRMVVDIGFLLFVPALVSYALKGALLGGKDDEEGWLAGLIREEAAQLAGLFIGVREFAGIAEGRDYTGPASFRAVSIGYQLAKQIGQGEMDAALTRAATQAAGVVFHFPATQVRRTAEGVEALWEGTTRNPAALVFGPDRATKR